MLSGFGQIAGIRGAQNCMASVKMVVQKRFKCNWSLNFWKICFLNFDALIESAPFLSVFADQSEFVNSTLKSLT